MIVLKFTGEKEIDVFPLLDESQVLKVDISVSVDSISPEKLDALKALGVKVLVPVIGELKEG